MGTSPLLYTDEKQLQWFLGPNSIPKLRSSLLDTHISFSYSSGVQSSGVLIPGLIMQLILFHRSWWDTQARQGTFQDVSGPGTVNESLESIWPVRGSAWMFGNQTYSTLYNIFKAEKNTGFYLASIQQYFLNSSHGPDLIRCIELHGLYLKFHNPAKKWCINNGL